MNSKNTIIVVGLITLALISRFIPHEYNFAPYGAIALFCSAYIQNPKLKYGIPVLTSWVTGIILNNFVYTGTYKSFVWFDNDILWQALSYILITWLGTWFYSKKISIWNVVGSAILASLLFFVITNFGFWTSGLLYPKTFSGLTQCFVAALPFFRSTLLGDLLFSGVLFGAYQYFYQKETKLA